MPESVTVEVEAYPSSAKGGFTIVKVRVAVFVLALESVTVKVTVCGPGFE